MSATYEPGTVAVATVRGVPNVRVMAVKDHNPLWASMTRQADMWWHYDCEVTDVRPLVTLDPEDREQVERLARVFRDDLFAVDDRYPGMAKAADSLQAALRSLVTPPKPEVYEHLTAGGGDVAHALCGKVWTPNPADSVTVVGRCPECLRLAESGWTA